MCIVCGIDCWLLLNHVCNTLIERSVFTHSAGLNDTHMAVVCNPISLWVVMTYMMTHYAHACYKE